MTEPKSERAAINQPEKSHWRSSSDTRYLDTEHLQHDLGRRSIRGGTITVVAQLGKVGFQLGGVVILARLLEPSDFGRFAMVGTILAVMELFKDLGLSTATVQRAEITHRQVSTLFWLNLALGALAAAVTAALAPLLVWLYGEPVLAEVTPLVACAFVFTGLSVQHLALMRRQMLFAKVAGVQVAAEIIAISAAIFAAFAGFGLWALVIQRIVWAIATAIGAWTVCAWIPGRPGSVSEIRRLLSFGANSTGAMLIGHLAANLDKVLIGWWWGATVLGFYDRAQRIVQLPIQNLNAPLATVALAALSRLSGQPVRYRDSYLAAVERLSLLMVPICAIFVGASDIAVPVVLGAQWHDAAPVLGWMGLSLVYMPATYSLGWLYMSQDRTPEMLRAGILNAVLTLAALGAGLPFGAVGVAAAYALSGAFVRAPVLFWMVTRRGPVRLGDLWRVLILPSAVTVAAVAAIWMLRASNMFAPLPPFPAFLCLVLVAGFISLAGYAVAPRGRRILADTLRAPRMLFVRKAPA